MRRTLNVIGTPIDLLDMEQALQRIEALIQLGRRSGKYHQVATVNVDFAVKALTDPELRYLLQRADMATADGMPLVWGARLLGAYLEDRVAGADLVPALAEFAALKGLSIYLLGAGPGIAARAAEILTERYPGLRIVGVKSPPFCPVIDMAPAIVEEIKAANPDILMVALGNPKQEKWIEMYGREVAVPVMIGVGGSLDFITGNTRRAPRWMQRLGLEWMHRLWCEPRRLWRRYVIDLLVFNYYFLRQWLAMRPNQFNQTGLSIVQSWHADEFAVLQVNGVLSRYTDQQFMAEIHRHLEGAPLVVLDLSGIEHLDSVGLGALMSVTNKARSGGGELALCSIPKQVAKILSLLKLGQFLECFADRESALAAIHTGKLSETQKMGRVLAEKARFKGTDWSVVKAPNRLNAEVASVFKQLCYRELSRNPHLIVDLSDTQLITSAGLAALCDLSEHSRVRNGELKIAGPSKDVRKVITALEVKDNLGIASEVATTAA